MPTDERSDMDHVGWALAAIGGVTSASLALGRLLDQIPRLSGKAIRAIRALRAIAVELRRPLASDRVKEQGERED